MQTPIPDKRLYMQLLVFDGCADSGALAATLEKSGLECVLYNNVLNPKSVGLLLMHEDPLFFTSQARVFLNHKPFADMRLCPEMTMFGRTYAIGHEQDMEDWLLKKPRRNVFDPKNAWAMWYPLRRKPEFEALTKEEQRPILMEHAKIGMAYGAAELANDVRLACYGLDAHDNEFVLGIVGRELHPLSALVQEMRKTQQTMKYIQSLGPFFIGSVAYRSTI